MPLSAAALSETDLEKTLLALFAEWLATFFDGATHAIGGNAPVAFPSAVLTFQQSPITQPLNGLGISLVWDARTDRARLVWETVSGARQQAAYAETTLMFWVRVAATATASTNERKLVQTGSDRLFAILQNSNAARPLAQKGIHRLRPQTPRVVAETNYQLRLIVCGAQLRWPVLSQVNQ